MDYFFSRIGRGIRYSATIIGGLACGVVIVLSIIGIQTIVIPICGGIALIPIGMVLFENIKVIKDLEKLVTSFKQQLAELGLINTGLNNNVTRLSGEINQLEQTKIALTEQTTRLGNLLNDAETKVITLSELAKTYETNANHLSTLTQDYKNQNSQLSQEVIKLVAIKQQYEQENNKLTSSIKEISQQLDNLSKIKEDYEKELIRAESNNSELKDITDQLKKELEKVSMYYEQAKQVIETLLRSKDVLDDIYNGMIKTEQQTSENVSTMSKLLNIFGEQRTMELFKQLDANEDGVLTNSEFINAFSRNEENV